MNINLCVCSFVCTCVYVCMCVVSNVRMKDGMMLKLNKQCGLLMAGCTHVNSTACAHFEQPVNY